MMEMLRQAIATLVERVDLSEAEAAACTERLVSSETPPSQVAAFLVALRMKGETTDEIAGIVQVMRRHSLTVEIEGPLLDTCGTGGDASGTFNVSTAAAFVAAGAGARVAKHGNRAMSSACGSADVLEALGGRIDLPPQGVAYTISESGFGFMFAQTYHPAMKHVASVRREIGVRTVFNIVGPLTNPAGAGHQVVGTSDKNVAEKLARVLQRLGTAHSLVVCGEDGLDEVSVTGCTLVYDVRPDKIATSTISPEVLGLGERLPAELKGGSPGENASALKRVLGGESSALRDFTVANAAVALVAADMATNLKDAAALAEQSLDSGAAQRCLQDWINSCARATELYG